MRVFLKGIRAIIANSVAAVKDSFNWKKDITDEEREFVAAIKASSNIFRMALMSLLILVFLASNFVVEKYINPHSTSIFKAHYLSANIITLVVASIFLIISIRIIGKEKTSSKAQQGISYLFWYLMALCLLYFNIFDVMERSELTNYFLLCLMIGLAPCFSTKEMLTLAFFIAIVQITVLTQVSADPVLIQQSLIYLLAVVVVETMLFSSFISAQLMQERLRVTNSQLLYISHTDPLTGVYNRRGLETAIAAYLEQNHAKGNIGLAVFDIDNFKTYNDNYGHLMGDECLKAVASCISSHFSDQLVARIGGEEFVIYSKMSESLIPRLLEAQRAVEQITFEVNKEYARLTEAQVTVSIGLSEHDISTAFATMFSASDAQLYLAKQNGKNCLYFNNERY